MSEPVWVEIPTEEAPVRWQCQWVVVTTRPPFIAAPEMKEYATREEAETQRRELRARYGPASVVVTVTPKYRKRRNPTTNAAKRATLDRLGWPVQVRPLTR